MKVMVAHYCKSSSFEFFRVFVDELIVTVIDCRISQYTMESVKCAAWLVEKLT